VNGSLPMSTLLAKMAEALDVDITEKFVPTKGTSITQSEIDEAKVILEQSLHLLSGKM
jgi:hypothetical protein